MATIAEAVSHLVLLRSSDQGIPLEECEGSTKDCSEDERIEPQEKEEELEHELKQEEEGGISEPEERKGELREIDQDVDSIIDNFLSTLVNPLNDLNEPLPIEFERDMEVDFSQPTCYDLSDGEEEKKVGEEAIPVQEHIEWVTISSMSFIGPHQYAILEMDYQLKIFLGLLHGGENGVGSQKSPKLIKKANSSLGIQAWCEAQLSGFRRVLGYYKGKLIACPSGLRRKNQQEGEWMPRIWDPGGPMNYEVQAWMEI
ncbi:hypothetical protein Ahy_B05g076474 [Arachis hypogaea]|uniref:Uncharacterized protein n=1 Tax=Arachis hypogaea TaxID=3818 RepID=A0A444Z3Q6_ARAHY|nr:hypothetical protein Ahy_B05g076474 [Arachis hypogaea]